MLKKVEEKINNTEELTFKDLMFLYDLQDITKLASLATIIRTKFNSNKVFYNKNFHLEPSNVCRHRCKFCSFRRDSQEDNGAWTMSLDQIEAFCKEKYTKGTTEVHIVGSVNPNRDFNYYCNVVDRVRRTLPKNVTIKGYSAVEIWDMCQQAGLSLKEGLLKLKAFGLEAIPGGGAEIFNPKVRNIICPDKINANQWLLVHKTAHELDIHSNATMLFGHIESREDRVDHLLKIRELQKQTNGFDAFIPLKYRIANNGLGEDYREGGDVYVKEEVDVVEVLKTFAISRLALMNVPHIKAYWPMLGKDLCQLALLFGADDIDGTINNSTKIYSMAGAEEQNPGLSVEELRFLAEQAGFKAVERDSYYNIIN